MGNKQIIHMTPSLARVLGGIKELIETSRKEGQSRLAPIKEIAGRLHASTATVMKAVSHLCRQGILHSKQRTGLIIAAEPGDGSTAAFVSANAVSGGWRAIHASLSSDLMSGRFRPGQKLPGYQQLCDRYGGCFQTVRKALLALASEGRITATGKGFRVNSPGGRGGGATLVVIAKTSNMRDIGTFSGRSAEFWRQMEYECRRTGITIVVMDSASALGRKKTPVQFPHTIVTAYMVIPLGMSEAEFGDVLFSLRPARLPVVIFDEVGDYDLPAFAYEQPLYRKFLFAAGEEPGNAMGTYLLNCGHRTIAWFSPSISQPWSVRRFEGLKRAYQAANAGNEIRLFCTDTHDRFITLYGPQAAAAAMPPLQALVRTVGVEHAQGKDCALIYKQILPAVWRLRYGEIFAPLFQKAAADPAVTAWACANDDTAIAAIDFLDSYRGRRHISVVGFDDTAEALARGLTSYNFNVPVVVDAIIAHILGQKSGHRGRVIEIPGIIMERASCLDKRRAL